jgi:hypothetical protein
MTTAAVRRPVLEVEGGSINLCARRFGVSPERLRSAVHNGELRAAVLHSRAWYLFFSDVRVWLNSLPGAQVDQQMVSARRVIDRHERRKRARAQDATQTGR